MSNFEGVSVEDLKDDILQDILQELDNDKDQVVIGEPTLVVVDKKSKTYRDVMKFGGERTVIKDIMGSLGYTHDVKLMEDVK